MAPRLERVKHAVDFMKYRYETSLAQSAVVTDGPATIVDFHLEPVHTSGMETSTKNTWHVMETSTKDTHTVGTKSTQTTGSVDKLVRVTAEDTHTTASVEELVIATTSSSNENSHATGALEVPLLNTLSPGEFEKFC